MRDPDGYGAFNAQNDLQNIGSIQADVDIGSAEEPLQS